VIFDRKKYGQINYAVFTMVRMHLAQSVFCTLCPFSIIDTFCKLGLNFRLVARMEKERL